MPKAGFPQWIEQLSSDMAESLAHEVGLLRTIVRNMERTLIPVDPRALAFWRAQGIEVPSGDQTWKTTIRPAGHDAFNQLSECLVTLFPAVERGAKFANFQNELFTQLEAYVGCDPAAIAGADARRLTDHFNEWLKGPRFAAQGVCPMRAHALGRAAI